MSLTDTAVVNAATALNDSLTSNGCQNSANSDVSNFQTAYNAAGGSQTLTVDGLYGAHTQAALQEVMSANSGSTLGSYTAPAGCVAAAGTPGAIVTEGPSTGGSSDLKWWLIGGGAVALAGGIWYYSKHHKGGRRRR